MRIVSPDARIEDQRTAPLRVAVLVDLYWSKSAGGHVKFWERVGAAAARHPNQLSLDVHFLGDERATHLMADNVRYQLHRPVFSTARLSSLSHAPDHTDLARRNPSLASALGSADVIHTTDGFFAFSRTAMDVSQARGTPLVNSVHTDTPRLTNMYTASTIRRILGTGAVSNFFIETLGIPRMTEARMQAKLDRHHAACAYVLGSREDELAHIRTILPAERVKLLRRGIELERFTPAKRDRAWLERTHGIPTDRTVVIFVGRLEPSKNFMLVAEAVKNLVDRGARVHFLCVGEGSQRQDVKALLREHVTCTGSVEPDLLARLYASCDIFAFPSEIEIHANVVLEAMASGLPALVAANGGMGRVVKQDQTGMVISGAGAGPWTAAIENLHVNPKSRSALGAEARQFAGTNFPTWDRILTEDLLPVWRSAAGLQDLPAEARQLAE